MFTTGLPRSHAAHAQVAQQRRAVSSEARNRIINAVYILRVTQLNSTQLNRELRTQVSDTSKSAS